MIPEPNWPYHHQYGYHAIPDNWAGRYTIEYKILQDTSYISDIMEWIEANIKNYVDENVWWVSLEGFLHLAFKEQNDLNWFILRWG